MANCSLLGTLIRFHGEPHLPHTTVERTMWEYLQYMHLVTLLQFVFERPKCETNILSKNKGNVPPQRPSRAAVFIPPWSQKPHIQDQASHFQVEQEKITEEQTAHQ